MSAPGRGGAVGRGCPCTGMPRCLNTESRSRSRPPATGCWPSASVTGWAAESRVPKLPSTALRVALPSFLTLAAAMKAFRLSKSPWPLSEANWVDLVRALGVGKGFQCRVSHRETHAERALDCDAPVAVVGGVEPRHSGQRHAFCRPCTHIAGAAPQSRRQTSTPGQLVPSIPADARSRLPILGRGAAKRNLGVAA